MRMPGEKRERETRLPLIYMIAGVSIFIFVILAVVISSNGNSGNKKNNKNKNNSAAVASEPPAAEDSTTDSAIADSDVSGRNTVSGKNTSSGDSYIDKLYRENKLRPDDLDFWDMYSQSEDIIVRNPDVTPETPVASPSPAPTPDPSEDGKHTLVERSDGTSEWVNINPYINKNTYDPLKLILKKDRMGYYEGQKQTSFFGVNISKYNRAVNFTQLKNEGVDFVMIRLGSRGYGSGQLLLDENFETNITGANEAGIDVGIYFFSQAITKEEASEEAAFVAQNLTDRKVAYPVAFDMEYISNDTSRIDSLSKSAKTEIANTFLSDIKTAGYIPMLYGNKEWLIEQVDLTKLMGYDVWLSQQKELPDYPYQYQMWQYSLKGGIAGITGETDFNISFVNYSAK